MLKRYRLGIIPMAFVLQFRGGCKDGLVLRSDSDDSSEMMHALVYFVMSDKGQVGKNIEVLSEHSLSQLHKYIVLDANEAHLQGPLPISMNHVYQVASSREIYDDTIIEFEYQRPPVG